MSKLLLRLKSAKVLRNRNDQCRVYREVGPPLNYCEEPQSRERVVVGDFHIALA